MPGLMILLGAAVAVAIAAYLLVALLRPERF
ncbi:MAG: K(+)-transporting ATPase subunit F [Rhodospirillales bacterium]|nr:K(+)-transporting ATPase subunit F [Rhodospirillales bacterium]